MTGDENDGTWPNAVLGKPLQALAIAASISALTLWLTGFVYGSNLNLFNIPFVERFLEREEFAADAFVTSLDGFTSAVWPPMRWLALYVSAPTLFLLAHIATRFATVLALLLLVRRFEREPWAMTASVLMVALAMILMEHSPVGIHQMFIDAFTHSMLTWPLIFLLLGTLPTSRFRLSAVILALLLDINAFVGLWMLALAIALRGREFWLANRRVRVQSTVLFLLFALPVVAWILGSMVHTGVATSFSYRQYVREYFPQHFLIEAASTRSLIREGLYLAAGWLAAGLIDHTAFWRRALACLAAIFLLGCVLPYLFDSRIVFNLHLLRVDGVLIAVSLIVQSLAFVRMIRTTSNWSYRLLLALVAASAFALPLSISLGLGALLILAFHAWVVQRHALQQLRPYAQRLPRIARAAPITAALLSCALVLLATWRAVAVLPAPKPPLGASWDQVAATIRQDGGPGPYLVPLGDDGDVFLLQAQRRPWVSWKEGAAVMWNPGFFAQWHARHSAVMQLKTPQALLGYAQANGIAQVVLKTPADCGPAFHEALRTTDYVWCSTVR
ncbi:hypothetical protein QTH91_15665 [Variovorax dokdonensis]|uniref:Uncharacterized protein n=1 Tax=Variovorax dokdonensis TaxID=344883 RepID=A0ABT7NDA0_9BURK|nr:hypothetical protein [Variovorax dokdonensis]MDM0045926.1 hypothetical protein [Variovorax dokdonensis]